jgi:hypothetical protein
MGNSDYGTTHTYAASREDWLKETQRVGGYDSRSSPLSVRKPSPHLNLDMRSRHSERNPAAHQPSDRDQIAFCTGLICTGARRSPAARGTNKGN